MIGQADILRIVKILRNATKVVKLMPFIYAIVYIFCMVGYLLFSDEVATLLDKLFYVSPISIIFSLCLSRTLKMCVWHRIECILPLLPTFLVFVDEFIMQFTVLYAYINVILISFLCIASLINAYFVFIKTKNNETYTS